MDADTTTTKGSHNRIIEEFNSGNYNILVGTQMISKGLNFPITWSNKLKVTSLLL